ncbi:MAG: hypothetical protein ACRDTT_07275, partial [Pseudonocardiaceae bacterium]
MTPPPLGRYGRSAGFRRNPAIVALGADVCMALILDGSRGAGHTAGPAEAAGIPTIRYEQRDRWVSTVDDCLIPACGPGGEALRQAVRRGADGSLGRWPRPRP